MTCGYRNVTIISVLLTSFIGQFPTIYLPKSNWSKLPSAHLTGCYTPCLIILSPPSCPALVSDFTGTQPDVNRINYLGQKHVLTTFLVSVVLASLPVSHIDYPPRTRFLFLFVPRTTTIPHAHFFGVGVITGSKFIINSMITSNNNESMTQAKQY